VPLLALLNIFYQLSNKFLPFGVNRNLFLAKIRKTFLCLIYFETQLHNI
jgi:hypothetical protein